MPRLRPYPHHPLSIEDKVLLGIRRLERRMAALEARDRQPSPVDHGARVINDSATPPRRRKKEHR